MVLEGHSCGPEPCWECGEKHGCICDNCDPGQTATSDQAEADLAWYGFTPDRDKALTEQFPSFEQVKHERPGGKQDREFRARWAAERAADYRFRHNMRVTNQEIRLMQEAQADRLIREYNERQRVEKQIREYRQRKRAA